MVIVGIYLFISKSYINLICSVNTQGICTVNPMIFPLQTVNIAPLYRFILTFIKKYVIILTIINNKYKNKPKSPTR